MASREEIRRAFARVEELKKLLARAKTRAQRTGLEYALLQAQDRLNALLSE